MARSQTVKNIRAKPNQRGVRSHLPLECSVKGCSEDFHVSKGKTYPPIRYCEPHLKNPPQNRARIAKLKSMGLL